MKRWLALVLACLGVGLVVAGCGGSDDNGDGGSDGGGAAASDQPAKKSNDGGGGGGGTQVTMEGIKFNPGTVDVKVGDTVTWTNKDSVGHDVTADAFKSGDSGGLQNGDTYKYTFKKAGTFDYVCTVHPGMDGSVVVK